MIGSQKQIECAETKTYSIKGYHNVRMILVLSSQRFSLLILASEGNVFSVISTFERNQPSSEHFTIPFLERSILSASMHVIFVYKLVGSHNSLVFCYRVFSINCYVRTIVALPSVSLYVTASQMFFRT